MIIYDRKQILKISAPLVLGMLIQVLVGVTDTAFLGRVGEIELGASAIAGILYLMFFMVSQGFASGAQIIMARRNGEKHCDKIAPVLYQTLNFILLFSAACLLVIDLTAPAILHRVISGENTLEAILIYLLPRCWGLFFSGTISILRAFFVAITFTSPLLTASLILLLTNFVLDYWFIFGGFGLEPMGIRGAALASVTAEAASALYLALCILKKNNLIKYGFNRFHFWQQKLFYKIFRLSVWIVVQNILGWGVWLYFFIEIEKLGADALAISNILRSLSSIPFIFASAMATVTSSIVSNLIGAGQNRDVLPTVRRIVNFGLFPYYGCILIMAALPEMFLHIYTHQTHLISEAVYPFYAMLMTQLPVLPGMIYFFAIYGTGKTKVSLLIEISAAIVYAAVIRILVVVLQLNLTWCWTAEASYYLVLLPISYFYMKRKKWQRERV